MDGRKVALNWISALRQTTDLPARQKEAIFNFICQKQQLYNFG